MVGFLNAYCELLHFIEIINITNKCNQYVICLSFIHFVRLFMCNIQTAVTSTSIENWTHVYMNLFTRNSPYCHLLKCLLFLLKHPVYIHIGCLSFITFVRLFMRNIQTAVSPHPFKNWTHVYMNLFTRNSPHCHLLKCLLFVLKHPVYINIGCLSSYLL